MGYINFGINKSLIEKIAKEFNIKNFIETGTYLGETTYWASPIFNNVYTIEISKPIYEQTSQKYNHIKNIEFYFGDSKNELPKIVEKVKGYCVFWLDGHWCGRDTGGKNNECPIFDELNQAVKVEDPLILIDDLRYFLGPNPNDYGENYPSVHDIMVFLHAHLPDHFITFHDDTLICSPNKYKPLIDNDWRNNYSKRFPQSYRSVVSKIVWRIKNLDFTLEKNR